jgi:AraC-like DNA-binding protein
MHMTTHQLGESTLQVAQRPLPDRITHMTRGCYGYEEWANGPVVRSEFANANVVVILEIAEPLQVSNDQATASHRGGFVAGIHDGPTRTSHSGHQAGIQLNLPPLVARQLLGLPLGEIAHQVMAAVDLLPLAQRARVQRLAELRTWDDRLDVVESLLKDTLERPLPRGFRELDWAITRIEVSGGNVSIRALAQALGWSERRLQRAFTEQIGVTPKVFARLVRFDTLMTRVHTHPGERWVDQALELGFSDQSHLVREVRQFSGVTPSLARQRLTLATTNQC